MSLPLSGHCKIKDFILTLDMSRSQKLRVFVSQRLNVAVEEILTAFEQTIAKYEEEAALSREVISRQHALLCALNKPVMDAPVADVFTQQLQFNQDVPPNLNQDVDLEPVHVEEKQEERLQDLDDVEIIEFTYNAKRATKPRDNFQLLQQEPVVPHQDVSLVSSSDTEDSEDYSKDSTEVRPALQNLEWFSKPSEGFSCQACSRIFQHRRILCRHVSVHIRDREQICGLCGEQFGATGGLKSHLQTHTKKRAKGNQAKTKSRESLRQQPSSPDKNKETQKPNNVGNAPLKKKSRKKSQTNKLDQDNSGGTKKKKRIN